MERNISFLHALSFVECNWELHGINGTKEMNMLMCCQFLCCVFRRKLTKHGEGNKKFTKAR